MPTPEIGEPVLHLDRDGEKFDAVVFNVYDDGMIDVIYNTAGDGTFGRVNGAHVDDQVAVATSVPEAEAIDESYSYIEGGWSA